MRHRMNWQRSTKGLPGKPRAKRKSRRPSSCSGVREGSGFEPRMAETGLAADRFSPAVAERKGPIVTNPAKVTSCGVQLNTSDILCRLFGYGMSCRCVEGDRPVDRIGLASHLR